LSTGVYPQSCWTNVVYRSLHNYCQRCKGSASHRKRIPMFSSAAFTDLHLRRSYHVICLTAPLRPLSVLVHEQRALARWGGFFLSELSYSVNCFACLLTASSSYCSAASNSKPRAGLPALALCLRASIRLTRIKFDAYAVPSASCPAYPFKSQKRLSLSGLMPQICFRSTEQLVAVRRQQWAVSMWRLLPEQ
jgi:hypothetical protein